MTDALVEMGVVGAAHGLKGEVRVKSFAGEAKDFGAYGPLQARDGRRFTVASLRAAGGKESAMLVVRFKEVADRNAAEALNGTALFVSRDSLPAPDDDEFYHADLIGLGVRDESGARIGRVTGVEDFGGGELLEIEHGSKRGVLVPFTRAAVPVVDVGGGFVTVDSQAAGLLEDEGEEDAQGGDAQSDGVREDGGEGAR